MTTDAYLYDLSLQQLEDFSSALLVLGDAGRRAVESDYVPRFSLIPGLQASMTLDFRMAYADRGMPGEQIVDFGADPAETLPLSDVQATLMGAKWKPAEDYVLIEALRAAPLRDRLDMATDLANSPALMRSVSAIAARLAYLCDWVPIDVPEPVTAPEPTPAAAAPDTSEPETGATGHKGFGRGPVWTDAEDEQAITIIATAINNGHSKADGMLAVETETGRSFLAIKARLRDTLGPQLKAALLHLRNADALAEAATLAEANQGQMASTGLVFETAALATEEPVVDPAPVQPDPHLPEPPPDADALTAHLLSMPRKDGWTLERDLDLAAMSVENGWGSQDIAIDLGLDTKAVKVRWDALTGFSRDDKTDKWVRLYAGRAVLDRLKTLSGAV